MCWRSVRILAMDSPTGLKLDVCSNKLGLSLEGLGQKFILAPLKWARVTSLPKDLVILSHVPYRFRQRVAGLGVYPHVCRIDEIGNLASMSSLFGVLPKQVHVLPEIWTSVVGKTNSDVVIELNSNNRPGVIGEQRSQSSKHIAEPFLRVLQMGFIFHPSRSCLFLFPILHCGKPGIAAFENGLLRHMIFGPAQQPIRIPTVAQVVRVIGTGAQNNLETHQLRDAQQIIQIAPRIRGSIEI